MTTTVAITMAIVLGTTTGDGLYLAQLSLELSSFSCYSRVSQHADVAALVTHHIVALAGPQEPHPQVMVQLNTPALPHSHTLPTITKHHPFTLLLCQIKGTITKVTNKTKGILEVNSKVLSCSSRETHMCRNEVESLSMHLLRVRRRERAAMESSDNHRRMQGPIGAKCML